ncbi:hypothetical protein Hanom_Chr05g00385871 [Helianthus anomalus]
MGFCFPMDVCIFRYIFLYRSCLYRLMDTRLVFRVMHHQSRHASMLINKVQNIPLSNIYKILLAS